MHPTHLRGALASPIINEYGSGECLLNKQLETLVNLLLMLEPHTVRNQCELILEVLSTSHLRINPSVQIGYCYVYRLSKEPLVQL